MLIRSSNEIYSIKSTIPRSYSTEKYIVNTYRVFQEQSAIEVKTVFIQHLIHRQHIDVSLMHYLNVITFAFFWDK